jgi:hypothetical protein
MRTPSYMWSVIDWNVVMRRIPVLSSIRRMKSSLKEPTSFSSLYTWRHSLHCGAHMALFTSPHTIPYAHSISAMTLNTLIYAVLTNDLCIIFVICINWIECGSTQSPIKWFPCKMTEQVLQLQNCWKSFQNHVIWTNQMEPENISESCHLLPFSVNISTIESLMALNVGKMEGVG